MNRYERRNPTVEACQHDGTNASAIKLEAWINSCENEHATAILKGSVDYAQEIAFVRIDGGTRPQNLVGRGAWVVKVDNGGFYAIPNHDFELLYLPVPVSKPSIYTTED